VLSISTFKDIPGSHDARDNDKVMHAMLEADNGMTLMGADTPSGMEYRQGTNISISLSGDNEAELTAYFEKLSAGGAIHQPLTKAPWGDTFGMLSDKFGIDWMVNISGQKA
jgi:PhnB protein